jgi:dolichol-phosphate mannosyltransferase
MKRVLITGGTGFVGANLARRLLRDGHRVHLLVRSRHHPWRIEEIRAHVAWHEGELGDADWLRQVVGAIRPEWVFHLAVYGAYPFQTDLRQMIQTNLVTTVNLVEASLAAECEVLVNTGSSSEYGFRDHAPAETEALEPNSHYAVTKASATLYCRHVARDRRARVPTLRLYSVYGPYEAPSRLMPALIVRGLRNEWPPLVDPEVARDYVYVEDVCEAYCRAAAQPGPEWGAVYNVGTGRQTALREVVEVARAELGITAEPQWNTMTSRSWDTHVWVADNRKIRRELGWEPRYTLKQGFGEMAQWFRDHPAWMDGYRR